MRVVKFKNVQVSEDTWIGQTIQPGEYWQLQTQLDIDQAAVNEKVNQDIWSDPVKLVINDGTNDLTPAEGDAYLKRAPQQVEVLGGTDSTRIGNVGDYLKVIAKLGTNSDFSKDPFGRLRVANPTVVFAYKFRSSPLLPPRIWDYQATGGASTTLSDNSSIELNTTTASGDSYIISTRQYIHYIPGYGTLCFMSGNLHGTDTNCVKRLGIYDSLDGAFFEARGDGVYAVLRSNVTGTPVDDAISQAGWNLDTMDGNGPSGVTIDWTKQQLFAIDYAWLSTGSVRLAVLIEGEIYIVHEFNKNNIIETPYSTSGDLPLRFEITNTGTLTAPAKMHITGVSAIKDGNGNHPAADVVPISSGTTEININSTLSHMMTIRMDPTANRYSLTPMQFRLIMTSGTRFIYYQILHNATLTGVTWSSKGHISQYAIGSDVTSFSGGDQIYEGHIDVDGATSVDSLQEVLGSFNLGRAIDGTSDTLTLVAMVSGGTGKVITSGLFRENL